MIAFAISVAALMSVQAMAVGFASVSRSAATTVVSDNDASVDYFLAGLYEADGTTPVTYLINGEYNYVSSGGVYTVNESNVGKEGIQLIIDDSNHVSSTYTVTGSWSVTGGAVPSYGSKIVCYAGNSGTYTQNGNFDMYREGDTTPSESIVLSASSNRLYFDLNLEYTSAPSSGTTIMISLVITDNVKGASARGGNTLTLKAASIVEVLDEGLEEYNDTNPVIADGTMEFKVDNDDPAGVYIQNKGDDENHSIANGTQSIGSQEIDFSITIPPGTKIFIYLDITRLFVASQVSLSIYNGDTKIGETGNLGASLGGESKYYVGFNAQNNLVGQKNNHTGLTPIICLTQQTLTLKFNGQEGAWSNVSAKLIPVP